MFSLNGTVWTPNDVLLVIAGISGIVTSIIGFLNNRKLNKADVTREEVAAIINEKLDALFEKD